MEKIIDNNAIDVGDTVYLIIKRTLQLSRKEKVEYGTHDALKVLSFFNHLSGDDEDPIVTRCCKVEDANGNVFNEELEILSLNPDDKAKRLKYFGIRILTAVAIVGAIVGLVVWFFSKI